MDEALKALSRAVNEEMAIEKKMNETHEENPKSGKRQRVLLA